MFSLFMWSMKQNDTKILKFQNIIIITLKNAYIECYKILKNLGKK